jgi:hypothetical protein
VQLAASSEAETGEGDTEQREGGRLGYVHRQITCCHPELLPDRQAADAIEVVAIADGARDILCSNREQTAGATAHGAACVIISRITQLQSFPTILFESMRAI